MLAIEVMTQFVGKGQPCVVDYTAATVILKLVNADLISISAAAYRADISQTDYAIAYPATSKQVRHCFSGFRRIRLQSLQLSVDGTLATAGRVHAWRIPIRLVDLQAVDLKIDMQLSLVDDRRLQDNPLKHSLELAPESLPSLDIGDDSNLEIINGRVTGIAPRPPLGACPLSSRKFHGRLQVRFQLA